MIVVEGTAPDRAVLFVVTQIGESFDLRDQRFMVVLSRWARDSAWLWSLNLDGNDQTTTRGQQRAGIGDDLPRRRIDERVHFAALRM